MFLSLNEPSDDTFYSKIISFQSKISNFYCRKIDKILLYVQNVKFTSCLLPVMRVNWKHHNTTAIVDVFMYYDIYQHL